ncbi:MAG TPA: hypothetical protein VI030_01775, partial [Propionibacteriaceae bacterium]
LAASWQTIPNFDAHPGLLNVANGLVDLRTSKVLAHGQAAADQDHQGALRARSKIIGLEHRTKRLAVGGFRLDADPHRAGRSMATHAR